MVHLQPVHADLHTQGRCFEVGNPPLHYLHDVLENRLLVKREATAQDVRWGAAAVGVAGTLLADGVLWHLFGNSARASTTALVTA